MVVKHRTVRLIHAERSEAIKAALGPRREWLMTRLGVAGPVFNSATVLDLNYADRDTFRPTIADYRRRARRRDVGNRNNPLCPRARPRRPLHQLSVLPT
jgi:hypothetical protein